VTGPAIPVRTMPAIVADDLQQIWHHGRLYWLRIKLTAEPAEQPEPGGFPWFPMKTDLGSRIADLVRADCAEESGEDAAQAFARGIATASAEAQREAGRLGTEALEVLRTAPANTAPSSLPDGGYWIES
jgi:hypothetical protein